MQQLEMPLMSLGCGQQAGIVWKEHCIYHEHSSPASCAFAQMYPGCLYNKSQRARVINPHTWWCFYVES